MTQLRVVRGLMECRELWNRLVPAERVSDLWDVRECFHRQYERELHFLVVEDSGEVVGFLPLSRVGETRCMVYFPGETWQGKTWLEQNRFMAKNDSAYNLMMDFLKDGGFSYHVRYLLFPDSLSGDECTVDETGYLFHPPDFDFELENYFAVFSGKSRKRIRREIDALDQRKLTMRFDCTQDFEVLIRMNLDRFQGYSYFADSRFTEGFRNLMQYFADRGWLRITTVLIDDEIAAVDMGCIFGKTYTVLAGGTNARFPGIAKYINLYHMRWACEERLEEVDFLCGDFLWKSRFHLLPRPLYKFTNREEACVSARAEQAQTGSYF